MTQLTFYTNPMSRGRIIRWMLEEVGQPYETVVIAWGANRSPDYLKINPMGKVPAIVHDGTLVTEAAVVIRATGHPASQRSSSGGNGALLMPAPWQGLPCDTSR